MASEDETRGSVMANAERMSPFMSGTSHFWRCSALPKRAMTCMFPVSGAAQLVASGARVQEPRTSHMTASKDDGNEILLGQILSQDVLFSLLELTLESGEAGAFNTVFARVVHGHD